MNYYRHLTLKKAKLLPTKPHTSDTMMPKEIVLKFANALKQFEPIYIQPSETNLTEIREVLTPLLLQISYNETEVIHNLIGLIWLVEAYKMRYDAEFSKPARVGAYDATIYVVRACTEAAHKAKRADRGT